MKVESIVDDVVFPTIICTSSYGFVRFVGVLSVSTETNVHFLGRFKDMP